MNERTPAECVADALAQLFLAGVLLSGKRSLACRAAGITPADLTSAQVRLSRRNNTLLRPSNPHLKTPVPAGRIPADDVPSYKKRNPRTGKPDKIDPSTLTQTDLDNLRSEWLAKSTRWRQLEQLLHCSGLSISDPHWAPLDEFRDHSECPWRKFSGCIDCTRTYQQARHLKVEQLDQLDRAGITISMAEGAPEFVCAECGKKIEEDQRGYVEGRIVHADCHSRAVPLASVRDEEE